MASPGCAVGSRALFRNIFPLHSKGYNAHRPIAQLVVLGRAQSLTSLSSSTLLLQQQQRQQQQGQPVPARHCSRRNLSRASSRSRTENAGAAAAGDFYGLLGVDRNASSAEIKRAYNSLVKKLHPDSGSGDADQFAKVVRAHEVLSDQKKRKVFDEFGEQGIQATEQGVDPNDLGNMGGGSGQQFANADEFLRGFDSFFGATGRPSMARQRGADLSTTIHISFEQAAKGCEQPVAIACQVDCKTCSGKGRKPGTESVRCRMCNGKGTTTRGNMFMSFSEPCQACAGEGQVFKFPCTDCKSHGQVSGTRRVVVKIPAGVDNGFNLKVAKKGDAGIRGAPPGDLYLRVAVAEDEYFHRDGPNIHVVAPIAFHTAVLGGQATVSTPLDGNQTVTVAPGTQPDDTRVLQGMGLPRIRSSFRGDQYVHFKLVIPTSLSEKQTELLRQFAEQDDTQVQDGRDSRQGERGLWKKFKKFLKQATSA